MHAKFYSLRGFNKKKLILIKSCPPLFYFFTNEKINSWCFILFVWCSFKNTYYLNLPERVFKRQTNIKLSFVNAIYFCTFGAYKTLPLESWSLLCLDCLNKKSIKNILNRTKGKILRDLRNTVLWVVRNCFFITLNTIYRLQIIIRLRLHKDKYHCDSFKKTTILRETWKQL